MATLRQAIPDYKTNGIFKNMTLPETWELTPEILDITLMGKYGNRTISPLLREFTNNMGVVNDMSGLSNMLSQLNMKNWDKSYETLVLPYNPIEPYKKDIDETITLDKDVSTEVDETDVTDGTIRNTGTVVDGGTDSIEFDSTVTETLSGDDTFTKDGSIEEKTEYNSTDTEQSRIDSTVSKAKHGVIEVTQEGSEKVRDYTPDNDTTPLPHRNYTETFTDNNRTHEGSDVWTGGVQHDITTDKSVAQNASTTEQVNAANPYDESTSLGNVIITVDQQTDEPQADETTSTTGFKPTDKAQVANNDYKLNEHELSETTENKDFSHTKVYEVSDKTSEREFVNRKETTNFGGGGAGEVVEDVRTQSYHLENGQKAYDEVESKKDGDDTTTTSYTDYEEKTDYGKVTTTVKDGADTRTIGNTRTNNLTTDNDVTNTIDKNETVAEDSTQTRDSLSTGNLGFMTSQRQIEEELELRKKHFYNILLKDVVDLLTIKVYT